MGFVGAFLRAAASVNLFTNSSPPAGTPRNTEPSAGASRGIGRRLAERTTSTLQGSLLFCRLGWFEAHVERVRALGWIRPWKLLPMARAKQGVAKNAKKMHIAYLAPLITPGRPDTSAERSDPVPPDARWGPIRIRCRIRQRAQKSRQRCTNRVVGRVSAPPSKAG